MNNGNSPFKEDDMGRTPLFYAVALNDSSEVEKIIYSLSGTGLGGQRYALITHKDQTGNEEIRSLLSKELGRMEFF